MKKLIIITAILFAVSGIYTQNITNTLGTSGTFTIKDATNDFFKVNQSNGTIELSEHSGGFQSGSLFKGSDRFIHTYNAMGTVGFNTFVGINSGNFTMFGSSLSGSFNTAVGHSTLRSLTMGSYNSAVGYNALLSNTIGQFNSAFGYLSLHDNTTGDSNTAFGSSTLSNNTTGYSNSAFGNSSLYSLTTGSFNTAVGFESLYSNDNGSYNTAVGYHSLYTSANSLSEYNTAVGYNSLYSNLSGAWNTAVGYQSGSSITLGHNNTTIGNGAQVPSSTGSNQVRIGNTSVLYASIQVAWTVTSDRKWKSNILSSNLGLNFISKLNPVSYTRINDEHQKTEYGLIAQEVEEVLKEEGVDNSGMLTVTDEGMYELRYNDLMAPMIKAIQELKNENERKDTKIAELEIQLDEMKDLKEKVLLLEKVLNELKHTQNDIKEVKLGEK